MYPLPSLVPAAVSTVKRCRAPCVQSVVLLLMLLHSVHTVPQWPYELQTAAACISQPNKTLPLVCPADHQVLINRAFYGHSSTGHCLHEDGNCLLEMTDPVSCVGREKCFFNLPSGDEGRKLPGCDDRRATYVHADYLCVPDTATVDLCRQPYLTSQSVFISTPHYPLNYPTYTDCALKVTTPFREQKIRVFIIDLSLERNETDCADWLHLFDGHRSETYCSVRYMLPAMVTFSNFIELSFHSNENTPSKGFWLYLEVFPFIATTTPPAPPPTTTPTTTTTIPRPVTTQAPAQDDRAVVITSSTENVTDDGSSVLMYTGRGEDSLVVGTIVGTLLGVLLCILIALLVILIYRRDEDQYRKPPVVKKKPPATGLVPPRGRAHKKVDPNLNNQTKIDLDNLKDMFAKEANPSQRASEFILDNPTELEWDLDDLDLDLNLNLPQSSTVEQIDFALSDHLYETEGGYVPHDGQCAMNSYMDGGSCHRCGHGSCDRCGHGSCDRCGHGSCDRCGHGSCDERAAEEGEVFI